MWNNKNVWLILTGELIAGFGLWLGIIGNLEFMQQYIPSDFMKSLIMFVGLLAGVLVGPTAGKIIDRSSKKNVLLWSGFGRVLSVSFMFLALHFESVFFMILFMIAIQISAAFYFPTLQAVIPLVVAEKNLLQMNGIHMNVATIARITGASMGGILLTFVSLSYMYVFSMIAYAILLAFTYGLQFEDKTSNKKEPNQEKQKESFFAAFHLLRDIPIALHALILGVIPTLFIGGFNLVVIRISATQHDPAIKGLLYTVEGISFIIGAFLVKYISRIASSERLLYVYSFFVAIAHLSLYFSNYKWMSLLSFSLFGLSVGGFFPISSTIFQTKIKKEYHGRLFSFRSMIDRISFQVVLLATGLFLDTIGLRYMVLVFGVVSLGILFFSSQTKKAIVVTEEKSNVV